MTFDELYRLWSKLIDLLEAGASIYDEEIDALIDAIEDGFVQLDQDRERALAGIENGPAEIRFEVRNG